MALFYCFSRVVPIGITDGNNCTILISIPSNPVELNTQGYPLRKSSCDNMWHSFRNVMNVKAGCRVYRNQVINPVVAADLIPYYFRHAFATDLKDANIPYRIRQELLGHSDGSVTDRYTHRTEASLNTARELLETFRRIQDKEIEDMLDRILKSGYEAAASCTRRSDQ